MNTSATKLGSAFLICIAATQTLADLVVFENNNPALDTLKMYNSNLNASVLGQAIDVHHDAFNQPEIGDLPGGSLFFLEVNGFFGDFIHMGMGRLTMTAKSTDETLIPDPFAGQLVPYFGPQDFSDGEQINSQSNFVDGFRTIHGLTELTDDTGIFTVDEIFTVGITFEEDDGTHFGFAQFERRIRFINDKLDVQLHPITWGYETTAGVGVSIIPAPAGLSLAMFSLLGFSTRRSRSKNI